MLIIVGIINKGESMRQKILIFILFFQFLIILTLGLLSYKNGRDATDDHYHSDTTLNYQYVCTKTIDSNSDNYKIYINQFFTADFEGTVVKNNTEIVQQYFNEFSYLEAKENTDETGDYSIEFSDDDQIVTLKVLENSDYLERWYKEVESYLVSDDYVCNLAS